MTTLTLSMPFRDDLLRGVEEFAEKEERSREEIVNEAIEIYLRKKKWNNIFADGSALAAKRGITEEDVNEAIRQVREEEKRSRK